MAGAMRNREDYRLYDLCMSTTSPNITMIAHDLSSCEHALLTFRKNLTLSIVHFYIYR